MDEEALRRAERLQAEVRRLTARLERLKSTFSYRLVSPIRLVERRLARLRRQVATSEGAGSGMPDPHDRSYAAWVARYDTIDAADIALAQEDAAKFAVRSTISIALLPGAGAVAETAQSLLAQLHRNFEVLTAPEARLAPGVQLALRRRAISVRAIRAPKAASEAELVAAMLRQARGDYLMAVAAGDRLAPLATYHLARAASVAGVAPVLVYGDEDEIGEAGERTRPFFKPDWDPELALACDYAGPATAIRTASLRDLGGPDRAAGPAWRWDAALKLEERQQGPDAAAPLGFVHLPFVLVHRRPPVPEPALRAAGGRVVAAALERRSERAAVGEGAAGLLAIHRALPVPAPLVSIVVATRDRVDLLRRCIEGVLGRTNYPSLDLTIIDNGSREAATALYLEEVRGDPRVAVLRDDGPFNFAALHNRAVRQTRGEILVLLNNDTEIIRPDWLERLVAQAVRPRVGAVGAKLYFPDDTIQHAGVIVGLFGSASHLHAYRRRDDPGPHGLLTVARDLSAVTGACLALRRSVWEEVGGMNSVLAVDYNDIDLCLRIRRAGYRVIWEPAAELYHHEAATRGREHASPTTPASDPGRRRFQREVALFRRLWRDVVRGDRAYNPNLTDATVDSGLAFPPRVRQPWVATAAEDPPQTLIEPDGVAIVGLFGAETGLGQAARNCARAFAAADYPASCHRLVLPGTFEEGVPFARSAETSSPHGTALIYLNADTLLTNQGRLPLDARSGRRRIGFWHWELPVFPAAWASAFDLLDELWTCSRYTGAAIAAATDKLVRVIPHPVVAANHPRSAARGRLGLPEHAFVFLSSFDTNSHVGRKNPDAVLRAFADAFPDTSPDGPILVMKCHGRSGRGAAFDAFARRAAAQPRVLLIDRVFTTEEVAMLQAASDAHVSLHRAEGFGFNLAEAMAEGRLAIGTGFSGNLEFMTPANSILIPYRMRAVEPGEYIHGHGQWWAEPDHDAAVEALRFAVGRPAEAAALARQAALDIAERHSFEAIGRQLVRALEGELPAVERPG